MKRFAFRLQPLLNFRNYKERLARQEVAKAQLDVSNCEKMIQNLKTTLVQSRERLDTIVANGMSAAVFQQYQSYLNGTAAAIESEQIRKAGLEKIVAEKRDRLKQKTIEKKTMERLKEKQSQTYSREVLMSEQKDLDEINAIKTARKMTHDTL